jgi:hypothetical protein
MGEGETRNNNVVETCNGVSKSASDIEKIGCAKKQVQDKSSQAYLLIIYRL